MRSCQLPLSTPCWYFWSLCLYMGVVFLQRTAWGRCGSGEGSPCGTLGTLLTLRLLAHKHTISPFTELFSDVSHLLCRFQHMNLACIWGDF